MPLEDLYCMAYAPIQGTCLLDLGEDDVTPETLQKELGYLEKFTSTALQACSKFFEKADVSSPEGAAGLYCLTSFFNRLQMVSLRAGALAGELLSSNKAEYHDTLKKLGSKARAEGLQPEDSRIEDLFEIENDAEWEVPAAGKGKVEFRRAVSMVAHKDAGSEEAEVVTHQPVKAEFTRKKVRKATGYAKFTFNAEGLPEWANKSDDETEATISGSQSSAPKTPSSVASTAGDSRAGDSRGPSAVKRDDHNPFAFLCCLYPNDDSDGINTDVIRRGSSVSVGVIQEIHDRDADANWHDSERQSGRFARIRGRIPTGHASLMKSSSNDMLDILLAEDSEECRRARELLLHNTQLNSCSPPLSPRSYPSESPRLSRACSNALEAGSNEEGFHGDSTINEHGVKGSAEEPPKGCTHALSILECHITSCS